MPTIIHLILYTTSNCHLCEQALELLTSQQNIDLTLIEIADSDALIDLYGTRIPVLHNESNAAELDWPFNLQDVIDFTQTPDE